MPSYKGKFRPINPDKYRGDSNNIIYRSLLERRFMTFCDTNPNVLEYASEEFFVRYYSPVDKKYRRYFPDFWIRYKNSKGVIIEKVIEVKPFSQCSPPKPDLKQRKPRRYLNEMKTYLINTAKWDAAKKLCEENNMEFEILTEKELSRGKK